MCQERQKLKELQNQLSDQLKTVKEEHERQLEKLQTDFMMQQQHLEEKSRRQVIVSSFDC
jgi:polyphosphate kinase 2 (PPK2 family)